MQSCNTRKKYSWLSPAAAATQMKKLKKDVAIFLLRAYFQHSRLCVLKLFLNSFKTEISSPKFGVFLEKKNSDNLKFKGNSPPPWGGVILSVSYQGTPGVVIVVAQLLDGRSVNSLCHQSFVEMLVTINFIYFPR